MARGRLGVVQAGGVPDEFIEPEATEADEETEIVVIEVTPALLERRKEITTHLRRRRIAHEWHDDELHVPVAREADTDAVLSEVEASPPAFRWGNELALGAAWLLAGVAFSVGFSYDSDADSGFPVLLLTAPMCWVVVGVFWRTVPLARLAAVVAALGVLFALLG